MNIDKELIDKITQSDFHKYKSLDDMFVILLDDKIFTPKQGRMFHLTYNDAWKHFYNQVHRMVIRKYKEDYAKSLGFYDWWSFPHEYPISDRQIWEEFKNQIVDCGFQIIRWRDAKRNVCS